MGIPLYGHGFMLNDPNVNGLYAPANQPQPACPYTRQAGSCGFNEVRQRGGGAEMWSDSGVAALR